MAKIFLLRHGEAAKSGDDTFLTTQGHTEAEALANKLLEVTFSKLYVSTLTRAKETLDHYTQKLSKAPEIIETERLKEIYRVIVGGPIREGTPEDREENDRKRADEIWDELLQEQGNIGIFAHGNIIRYFLMKTLGIKQGEFWTRLFLSTGSICVIEINSDGPRINAINLIDHLPTKKEFYEEDSLSTVYHP